MTYLLNNLPAVGQLFFEHLRLTVVALGIALGIALPVGVVASRIAWLRGPLLGVLGVIYTIPSLSLLILLIPLTGLSPTTAIITLVAYALLVLVRNTVVGLTGVDPAIVEAARGMGMDDWQRLWRVELPLALPLIVAGARLAAISIIGIGTVAAFISAGGLGVLLFDGVRTSNYEKIIAGAIAVTVLAAGVNLLLRLVERRASAAIYGEER
jgi:osmoprotectant transport system permease protein